MYFQFNVVLGWRPLEEKDQGEDAEKDAAEHAELVHVRERHRLTLGATVPVVVSHTYGEGKLL
jgi:hypothetical protein